MGHKKQHVPIFASNLGLLEPSRGPAEETSSPVFTGSSSDGKPNQLPITDISAPQQLPVNTPQVIPHFDFSTFNDSLAANILSCVFGMRL